MTRRMLLGILGAEQPPRYVPVARIRAAMKTAQFEDQEAVAAGAVGGAPAGAGQPQRAPTREEVDAELTQKQQQLAAILRAPGQPAGFHCAVVDGEFIHAGTTRSFRTLAAGSGGVLPPELVDEKTEVVKMINNIMAGQEFVLDKSLDVIEKGIIERSLEKFGFNQSKAAAFLGMTEQTFRYKLKRLGIASARARA